MRQQINLLKTLPKQEYEWLSLSRMKKVCLAFVALLIIVYLFSLWQNYNLGREFKSVQAREKAQLENVKAVVEKLIFPRFNGHRFPKYYAANSTSLGVL